MPYETGNKLTFLMALCNVAGISFRRGSEQGTPYTQRDKGKQHIRLEVAPYVCSVNGLLWLKPHAPLRKHTPDTTV
jgi:hypothetical protein